MRRMEGKGPIAITNKDQVGTGDALVYDKPENKFYLIGNVALSQGENITRGDKLIYDLNTGQAVVTSKGRVHSLIVPGDQQAKPGASAKPDPKPAPNAGH
jgi:lipopolysaccharide export system protein LptA